MIGLMFALLSGPTLVETQAVQATLQSCALENGRYVCRYAVPDIVIVPVPGTDIVADAPAVVLGSVSGPEAASPETLPLAPAVTAPATSSVSPPVAPPVVADPGPIQPIDTGVLTEREAQLVSRCADAGWMSLCLPDDRRAARTLRDKQTAYLAVRREVTRLLSDDDCDAAVKAALDGGYLALARETRDYCRAETAGVSAGLDSVAAAVPSTLEADTAAKGDENTED
jgi:hypothetical protein